MTDSEDELTAYHEAGHCVMAILLGGRVHRATVSPEEEGLYGQVEIEWSNAGSKRQREAEIWTILAGPVAEMIYRNEPLHPALVAEWSDDWSRAFRLAKPLVPDESQRNRWLEKQIAKLHQKISQDNFWAAIAATSDLFLAHDDLEHEQILEEVRVWIG